jgi:hypothetical protein
MKRKSVGVEIEISQLKAFIALKLQTVQKNQKITRENSSKLAGKQSACRKAQPVESQIEARNKSCICFETAQNRMSFHAVECLETTQSLF